MVTNTTGITTTYLYDARGRRVAKVTAGITVTHYLYDTQYRVLEERDGAEELLARYTYGAGIDEPLALEIVAQEVITYYYHRDALGSVTELSDASGAIVERYEYDVYGAVTIYDGAWLTRTASAAGNPYLFTSRRYDPESGNYYYRARVYSPALGRFLSMDPLGFEAGDYNLYRYAGNNPTTLTDPTGEFAFIPWLLKASAEAAADALMQALFNYFFDTNITTVEQAFQSIDLGQVGVAFVTGLLPGGRWLRSIAGAAGDVILYILDAQAECREPSLEEILSLFAFSLGAEIIGDYVGDAVAKYGTQAVAKGLRKLGFDELAEKILRQLDELLSAHNWQEAEDLLGKYLGATKNTRRFYRQNYPGLEANYRVPDFVEPGYIADAKWYNASSLTESAQLRDFVLIARTQNKPLYIYVRQDTQVTDSARDLVEKTGGDIIRKFK
jgi:RHS repeat-associated protein